MYILKLQKSGQMEVVEFEELMNGDTCTLVDFLYHEKGFFKVDEVRKKDQYCMLVSDKYGNRPRHFSYQPGIFDSLNQEDIVGNVVVIPEFHFILAQKRTVDTVIIMMKITEITEDNHINVVVHERFIYEPVSRYASQLFASQVVKLAIDLIGADDISPKNYPLFRMKLPEKDLPFMDI